MYSQTRLTGAVVLSLGLHAVGLLVFARPHSLTHVVGAVPTAQFRVLHVNERAGEANWAALDSKSAKSQRLVESPAASMPRAEFPDSALAAEPTSFAQAPRIAESPASSMAPSESPYIAPTTEPTSAYRSSGTLSPAPRVLEAVEPEYPEAADWREGTVLLRVRISSTGAVEEVVVVSATTPGYFEASAMTAFANAKFSPGYFFGVPVPSELFIEVDYTALNRGPLVARPNG